MTTKLKIALLCGGPSAERGISLNSARSLLDHLGEEIFDLRAFYITPQKEWYLLPLSALYSNTPADFDFKLQDMGTHLSPAQIIEQLRHVDLVFPAIHGAYGEDGELQEFLEQNHIPFVGPSAAMCQAIFHKYHAARFLEQRGFPALPSLLFKKNEAIDLPRLTAFFQEHALKKAIVKPVSSGSSLGVHVVTSAQEAQEKLKALLENPLYKEAMIEPFCKGREFTVVVLQNPEGRPVAMIPNEIVLHDGEIYDYRRKYLPSNSAARLSPPSCSDEMVEEIRTSAQSIFQLFGLRDFVRMDGWILEGGQIVFTDFNPISGMEQNSFVFLQPAAIGMSHQEVLQFIIANALKRDSTKTLPAVAAQDHPRKPVWVVFGGKTAERQVSVMSGTNVWLKLLKSELYAPTPFFLDPEGFVWQVPYVFCLNHTAEEIYENCKNAAVQQQRLEPYIREIRGDLGLPPKAQVLPHKQSLDQFLDGAKKAGAFVFLGLHGGPGEDGTFQKKLEEKGLPYNGSRPTASHLCMDKFLTGLSINGLQDPFIRGLPKVLVRPQAAPSWPHLLEVLGPPPYIIKPKNDGCSAGVLKVAHPEEIATYLKLMADNVPYIPPHTFAGQSSVIEVNPGAASMEYIVEPFIEVDRLDVQGHSLHHIPKKGWIECTVVVTEKEGHYHALNPSITVAESHILSVEEKFQGGTGINITPPPETLISKEACATLKQRVETIARRLGIENYARIDVFFNIHSQHLVVIEANSLPALTPSTVLYHQALAEKTPLAPRAFLEARIGDAILRWEKNR